MNAWKNMPLESYGILDQHTTHSVVDEVLEQMRRRGYAILHSDYNPQSLSMISEAFDNLRSQYIDRHGEPNLRAIHEFYTLRAPLLQGDSVFRDIAFHSCLLDVLKRLFQNKFILNQQNGIINPPKESYNQGMWHRDLPYQHFVSSKPLAINALFCVDSFTNENGATWVLPHSHKEEPLPSLDFIQKNAIQIEAPAGSFILLDGMLFHSGGFNRSDKDRRALNHVYTLPMFKQQIHLPTHLTHAALTAEQKDLLGFNEIEPKSIADYLLKRQGKAYG